MELFGISLISCMYGVATRPLAAAPASLPAVFAARLAAALRLTGRNSVMDFGFWIILAVLIVLTIWIQFRRRK